MIDSHDLLTNLALVLSVAALTSLIFQRLRQPVVFGYLVAGMIIGPYIPIPLVANEAMVHAFSELGVVLLMFSIGLEFNLRKLVAVGGAAGTVAVVQVSAMIGIGYLVGRIAGWTPIEGLFLGAAISISSTTIIAKAFAEQGIRGRVADIVLGILIVEDLIAILLVAILTAVGEGGGLSPKEIVATTLRLVLFLANEADGMKWPKEMRAQLKTMQRDVHSLTDHATYLSNKITFLLDALIGLVTIEQNNIIKIFSVGAVALLPPTLIASIYGMNFEFMPELKWAYGYPFAIVLMFVAALLPYIDFKWKRWL